METIKELNKAQSALLVELKTDLKKVLDSDLEDVAEVVYNLLLWYQSKKTNNDLLFFKGKLKINEPSPYEGCKSSQA